MTCLDSLDDKGLASYCSYYSYYYTLGGLHLLPLQVHYPSLGPCSLDLDPFDLDDPLVAETPELLGRTSEGHFVQMSSSPIPSSLLRVEDSSCLGYPVRDPLSPHCLSSSLGNTKNCKTKEEID